MSRVLEVSIDGGPYALAAGSDGAMWVTLVHAGQSPGSARTVWSTCIPSLRGRGHR